MTTIVYQGQSLATDAANVRDFLQSRAIDLAVVVVEYQGEIYGPGADLGALALTEGATLDTFNIVPGG